MGAVGDRLSTIAFWFAGRAIRHPCARSLPRWRGSRIRRCRQPFRSALHRPSRRPRRVVLPSCRVVNSIEANRTEAFKRSADLKHWGLKAKIYKSVASPACSNVGILGTEMQGSHPIWGTRSAGPRTMTGKKSGAVWWSRVEHTMARTPHALHTQTPSRQKRSCAKLGKLVWGFWKA